MSFMLALTSRLLIKDKLTREGPAGWARRSDHMGTGLTGRVLGQLGIGNIGAEVFRLAAPLGMRFIAHDPYAPPELARQLGVELVPLERLFCDADVLSISVPLNDETRGLVGDRLLGLMKPSAFLINTARGPIIDQSALVRALQDGTIAGAGLDVFAQEPVVAEDPLLRLDNVILSPHALCWTDECFSGNGAADIRAVLDLSRGKVPGALVDPRVAEDPAFRSRIARWSALAEHKAGPET
jgi:phosphoglycerate dehydrogenase-like enzyme